MTAIALFSIALSLGAGALCKGAIGMGLPLVALPILSTFLGVQQAIAILTIPIVATNAWQVWQYRAMQKRVAFLPVMMVTGAIGVPAGTVFLTQMPEDALALALGILLLIYISLRLTLPAISLSEGVARRLAPTAGFLAGGLQGATGLSGPVLVSYLHALQLNREAYILAISIMYLLLSLTQIPALALAGLFTWTTAMQGLFALLPVVLIMPIGMIIGRRFNQAVFDRILLFFLGVMSMRLLYQGLVGS